MIDYYYKEGPNIQKKMFKWFYQIAKSRNYKFQVKGIRNDIVLHKSSLATSPGHIMRTMVKLLNKREDDWTQEQRRLQKLKIEEKMEMAKKQSQCVNKLLSHC